MNIRDYGLNNDYKQLSIRYDHNYGVLWSYFDQKNIIPSFNRDLVNEIIQHQKEISSLGGLLIKDDEIHHVKYSVSASKTPNVFILGGHLALIAELARNKNREALLGYATKGIDILYNRLSRFGGLDIYNISLVQGLALGAGLEAALASDVVIAEKKSLFSFPEIHFNMFPGMGGYSLLVRKAGAKVADEMILKGKQYTAEQAYDMGLVDVLAEDGEGEKAVFDWIEKNKRTANGTLAALNARNRVNPITREELMDITQMWVDVALKLSERDFSIMERFIYAQEKQYLKQNQPHFGVSDNIVPIKRTAT